MKTYSKLTIPLSQLSDAEKLLAFLTKVKVSRSTKHNEDDTQLISLHFENITNYGESDLDDLVTRLRKNSISFSYEWCAKEIDTSGEVHYRKKEDGEEQYLSWLDSEKNIIDTSTVRTALQTGGETAVFELLDRTEDKYLPWPWGTLTKELELTTVLVDNSLGTFLEC